MEDAASRASVSEDYAACYPSSESQIVSNPAVAEDIPGTETASQEASSRCKIPICGPLHPLDSASAQLVFASCANVFPHPLLLAQAVLGIESIDFSDFLQVSGISAVYATFASTTAPEKVGKCVIFVMKPEDGNFGMKPEDGKPQKMSTCFMCYYRM